MRIENKNDQNLMSIPSEIFFCKFSEKEKNHFAFFKQIGGFRKKIEGESEYTLPSVVLGRRGLTHGPHVGALLRADHQAHGGS